MSRTVDDAFRVLSHLASEGRFAVSAAAAINAALSALPSRHVPVVKRLDVEPSSFTVDIVSSSTTGEVALNDVVASGITLRYSAAPNEGLAVAALFHRLRCLNGATFVSCGAPSRILRQPGERHLFEINTLVGQIWGHLPRRLEEMRSLPRKRADVPRLLEDASRRAGLSPTRIMPRLLRAWREEEAASTEWHGFNALTRLATHAKDIPAADREALSRTAGVLAFRGTHSCSHCAPDLTWRNSRLVTDLKAFVIAGLRPLPRS